MSKSKAKNGKTSSQDYVNLIYTDSDSDTVPDLNLPPLKGKKPKVKTKTRRNPNSQQQSVRVKSACSLCTVLRVIVGSLLCGSVVSLGIISYWLMQQIMDLKDQMNTLENRHAATPEEVQALQSRLSSIDKAVSDIRSGKSGLQSLNKSIVSMQAQIASLAAAQQQQQQNFQTSNSQDGVHEDMAKTVADLGSGLHSSQEDVKMLKESQKTFTSQLKELSNRVSVLENPHGREGGISQSDTEGLQVIVTQVNNTLSQSVAKVVADLNKQQTHIEALDQFTQGLQERVGDVRQLALSLNQSQHLLQEAVLSFNDSTPDTGGFTALQDQVNQLQLTLEQGLFLLHQMQSGNSNLTRSDSPTDLSSPPPSDSAFQTLLKDHEDFVHFRSEVYEDISRLNATMASVNGSMGVLRTDVANLFIKVTQALGGVKNVTAVMESVVSFVHTHHLDTVHEAGFSNPGTNSLPGQNTRGGGLTTKTPVSSNLTGKPVQSTTPAIQSANAAQRSSAESSQGPA